MIDWLNVGKGILAVVLIVICLILLGTISSEPKTNSKNNSGTVYVQPVVQPVVQPKIITPFSFKESKETEWNDSGEGKTEYLDRHDLNCGNNAISYLRLADRDDKIAYAYDCSSTVGLNSPVPNITPVNEIGNHNTEYLDRHDINCGPNSVLNRFKLYRNGDKINYGYICSQSKDPLSCRNVVNPVSTRGNGTTKYLNNQMIGCNHGEVLSRIKLDNNGENFYYTYTCCKKAM